MVASLLGKLLDLVGDGLQSAALDTGDNGRDQASGSRDGNRDIDSGELANAVTAPAGVDSGYLHGSNSNGLDEEVVDRQLVLAVRGAVQGLAQLHQLVDRQRAGDEEVGVVLDGLLQTASNDLAHTADGNVLVCGARSGDSRAADSLLDILLSDLATFTRTLNTSEADALFTSKTHGSRKSIGLTVESGLELLARRGVLLRLGLRSRGGCRFRFGLALRFLLLGRGRLGVAAGILDCEFLESRDVGTFFDKNGDGLAVVVSMTQCIHKKKGFVGWIS